MRPDDHMGRTRISDFNLVPQLAQLCIDAMGLKYHLLVYVFWILNHAGFIQDNLEKNHMLASLI